MEKFYDQLSREMQYYPLRKTMLPISLVNPPDEGDQAGGLSQNVFEDPRTNIQRNQAFSV